MNIVYKASVDAIEQNYRASYQSTLKNSSRVLDMNLKNIVDVGRSFLNDKSFQQILENGNKYGGSKFSSGDRTKLRKVANEMASQQVWVNYIVFTDLYGHVYQLNNINQGTYDFYMYYDNKNNAVFVLISDVDDGNNNATTYSYVANGEYTKNTTYDDVQLTFDPTNGRITQIAIPTYAADGTVSSWTAISVSAETVTDDAAYEDAYNKYEYDTYLYDQKNKEINAKTEVIQQEDKNLELKLQRLDNERTQITTEIEAVEKVINDNIEASYKTFSG